jgi:hypothetical protein
MDLLEVQTQQGLTEQLQAAGQNSTGFKCQQDWLQKHPSTAGKPAADVGLLSHE